MKRSLVLLFLSACLFGCVDEPEPQVAPPPPPPPQKVDTGPTSMESDIGGLSEEAVESAFASLDIGKCVGEASQKFDQLGGQFKIKVRIDKQGHIRWAYLSESTLGDRDAEKCVLGLVRAKTWPKPLGGEGLAEKNFEVDSRTKPFRMDEKRVLTAIARARSESAKCRNGVRGPFQATVYLRADGRVVTAGVAVPSEQGETIADCVVEAIRKQRYHTGAPKASKLNFEIR